MISVIIPTVRTVELNLKCLKQQTHKDFETIIARREGDVPKGLFYTLNRDYNEAFKRVKGDLIISYQDLIEIRPDCLERFWYHFNNDGGCVGAIGDQYSSLEPPIKVWSDPRRKENKDYYECYPIDIEFSLCAIPKKAIYEVGGMDEEYDKGAAVGEKEMMLRIDKLGYKSYLDQSIEYRAIKHPRLTKDWDHYYGIANELYVKHVAEINRNERLKLNYLT